MSNNNKSKIRPALISYKDNEYNNENTNICKQCSLKEELNEYRDNIWYHLAGYITIIAQIISIGILARGVIVNEIHRSLYFLAYIFYEIIFCVIYTVIMIPFWFMWGETNDKKNYKPIQPSFLADFGCILMLSGSVYWFWFVFFIFGGTWLIEYLYDAWIQICV